MTIILFLLILTALIFVHELGHFSAAKLFGIRVDEFALGFPPNIWSFKKGETKYSINLIPFGGYVKIFGENPSDLPAQAGDSMQGTDSARSLANAPKWKQIIIMLAGIFMNFIFAWLLISAAFNIGMTVPADQYNGNAKDVSLIVTSVLSGSPAELAGLEAGDKILDVSYGSVVKKEVTDTELEDIISQNSGMITIDYQRNGQVSSVGLEAKDGIVPGKKAVGISIGMVGTVKFGFLRSFYEGAKTTTYYAKETFLGISNFIYGALTGRSGVFDSVAGPVGIAGMVGEAEHIGLSYLFEFISLISINLAILNLIPFPALDGGRIFFVLIESIFRKKIKPEIFNYANLTGFALLMILMIFVTYKDILRLVK